VFNDTPDEDRKSESGKPIKTYRMKTSFKLDIYLEVESPDGTDRAVVSSAVEPLLVGLESKCANLLSKEISFKTTGFKRHHRKEDLLPDDLATSVRFLSKAELLNGHLK
jgi:hypothetical protein